MLLVILVDLESSLLLDSTGLLPASVGKLDLKIDFNSFDNLSSYNLKAEDISPHLVRPFKYIAILLLNSSDITE